MRIALLTLTSLAVIGSGAPARAQTLTADDVIARYVKTVGGADKIQSIRTLRRIGKYTGDDGFEAGVMQESTRPNRVRQEFSIQGMTGINAYDGANGWKIDPFGGKKDPEALSEEELRSIVEDSDFDEPLINYKQKGNKVEFAGTDQVEGTDVYKLRVTLKSGDTRTIIFYDGRPSQMQIDRTDAIGHELAGVVTAFDLVGKGSRRTQHRARRQEAAAHRAD